MSWFVSIMIGVLSAAIGGVLSGIAAGLYVEWYHVSSFEGGSGYFVAAFVLLGMFVGLVSGITASRVVAAGASPGAIKALAISAAILIGMSGTATGISRFFADVPPKLNGEELLLLVEVRWPASQKVSPATDTILRTLRLGALSGHTQRKSELGPLWLEDARLEEGRWVVPGAVEIFTNRGTRVIDVDPPIPDAHGLLLPMKGTPSSKNLEWSEWMPRARPGAAPLPDQFTYRFKVVPRNVAVRTQTFGPFEVGTIARSFWQSQGSGNSIVMSARADFSIRYKGKPVTLSTATDGDSNAVHAPPQATVTTSGSESGGAVAKDVAVLQGSPPALLVRVESDHANPSCQLLEDRGDHVQFTFVSRCTATMNAPELTNDQARYEKSGKSTVVYGQVDRTTYANAGVFLFEEAIFDADKRTVLHFSGMEEPTLHGSLGPIGFSPAHSSIVRLGYEDTANNPPALVVIDAASRTVYRVSIDQKATRYGGAYAIGPDWLNHYYTWQVNADGHEHLVVRPNVQPLPFKGVVKADNDGFLEYQVGPAGKAMAEAMQEFVLKEFQANRTPEDQAQYGFQVHIGPTVVHVFNNESEGHVTIFADRGTDTSIVARIAERFNAALATGRYDALFTFGAMTPE